MIQHRHINRIYSLEDSCGQPIQTHSTIEKELVDYYKDLLSEPCQERSEAITKITRHIPALILEEQNMALTKPITIEEVDTTMMEMQEGKSPRPDVFTVDFFHHC